MLNKCTIVITTQWNPMHVIVILKSPLNPLNKIIMTFHTTDVRMPFTEFFFL